MTLLMHKLVLVAVIAVVIFDSSTQATSQKRELSSRHKRSFNWIPFFGSESSSTKTAEGEDIDESEDSALAYDDNAAAGSIQQYVISPQQFRLPNGDVVNAKVPDASEINSIINRGHVVNNQLHYPIWRVHKYNGIHLRPLPVSLVAEDGTRYTQTDGSTIQHDITQNNLVAEHRFPEQTTDEPLQNHLTPQNTKNQEYPPELIELAHQFGVIDLSKFPSLEEAMGLLGTTTQEETVQTIKEFAATEDGRNLIRQFIGDNEAAASTDNEVAASEIDENVQAPTVSKNAQTPTVSENDQEGASTNVISQYLLPREQSSGIFNFPFFGSAQQQQDEQTESESEQYEEQQEAENETINTAEEEQTSSNSPTVFQRISQWAHFLNPLANREEISIPPNDIANQDRIQEADAEEGAHYVVNSDDQNTIQIPNLPDLPALPSISGVSYALPELPKIHIPSKAYASPNALQQLASKSGGTYVRVRLPLAGFNPTPQIPIDPNYLYYYYNQLARQQQSRVAQSQKSVIDAKNSNIQSHRPNVVASVVLPDSRRVLVPTNEPAFQLPSHQITQRFRNEQTTFAQRIDQPVQHLLPPIASSTFRSNVLVASAPQIVTHVGQLPLIRDANYEVFRNTPQIANSYVTPALPFSYSLDKSANTFQQPSAAYIHQEYELRPAASEKVEKSNAEVENRVENEEVAERSTKSETIAAAPEHQEANHEVKSEVTEKPTVNETEENIVTEATTTTSPTTVAPTPARRRKIKRTRINNIVANERKNAEKNSSPNIQRITPHDTFATGKLHKADPKAMELLPFTIKNALEKDVDE